MDLISVQVQDWDCVCVRTQVCRSGRGCAQGLTSEAVSGSRFRAGTMVEGRLLSKSWPKVGLGPGWGLTCTRQSGGMFGTGPRTATLYGSQAQV